MSARKRSPLHDKWHRRVEGQIKDCIHQHPRWFSFGNENDKLLCINSLAKRIVGEIVAEALSATMPEENGGKLTPPEGKRGWALSLLRKWVGHCFRNRQP